MQQRLFLALFFLLVLLMAVLVLAFSTIPPVNTVRVEKKSVEADPSVLDYSQQFAPLTLIAQLPAGTMTVTDVFDASGNRLHR